MRESNSARASSMAPPGGPAACGRTPRLRPQNGTWGRRQDARVWRARRRVARAGLMHESVCRGTPWRSWNCAVHKWATCLTFTWEEQPAHENKRLG